MISFTSTDNGGWHCRGAWRGEIDQEGSRRSADASSARVDSERVESCDWLGTRWTKPASSWSQGHSWKDWTWTNSKEASASEDSWKAQPNNGASQRCVVNVAHNTSFSADRSWYESWQGCERGVEHSRDWKQTEEVMHERPGEPPVVKEVVQTEQQGLYLNRSLHDKPRVTGDWEDQSESWKWPATAAHTSERKWATCPEPKEDAVGPVDLARPDLVPHDSGVEVIGALVDPWETWDMVKFPRHLLSLLPFSAPTKIQQHAWPILWEGMDLIGIAKTGSGKTLAFLLPVFARMLVDGPPAMVVLAPTRELACQIRCEAQKFPVRTVSIYGGAPKGPQLAEMRLMPHVVVATPGRLNDFLEPPAGYSPGLDVGKVQYLVLDEADMMLDMGFEPQIRRIISKIPKDRQTMMFTATWPVEVRRLATDFLRNPAEVRIGDANVLVANADIDQRVIFCSASEKDARLRKQVEDSSGPTLVFVSTKRMCEVLTRSFPGSVTIHGDRTQSERDSALAAFKSGAARVMIATNVAARGLDIKGVALVVNYDPAVKDEDYVHRIGRTGRGGERGTAVSLITQEDGRAALTIAEVMDRTGLPVPDDLAMRLASGELRVPEPGVRDGSRRRARSAPASARSRGGLSAISRRGVDISGGFGFGLGNDCPTAA